MYEAGSDFCLFCFYLHAYLQILILSPYLTKHIHMIMIMIMIKDVLYLARST